MVNKQSLSALALFLGVLMLLSITPVQASSPPDIVSFPVAGMVFANPCNGDVVTLTSGIFQIVTHVTTDASGGFHAIAEGNARAVKGLGTSGDIYQAAGGFWAEFTSAGATASTDVSVLNIMSQGSGDNFAVIMTFHITVNANGDVTSFFTFGSPECRG